MKTNDEIRTFRRLVVGAIVVLLGAIVGIIGINISSEPWSLATTALGMGLGVVGILVWMAG